MAKKKSATKKVTKKKTARTRAVAAEPRAPGWTPPAPIPMAGVLGQARAMGVLDASLRSERVHHAWIFHGPSGVGKFTAAMAFAALLLDPTTAPGLTGEVAPDPDSETQRLLREGLHPDLHVIVKELARYSDDRQVRERKLTTLPRAVVETHLLEPIARRATREGGLASKVFVLDEAELLGTNVQNAVLKTLEEPPEGTVLILVTSSEERLLPTIRSRAQRVAFGPLPDEAMGAWLKAAGVDGGNDVGWAMAHAAGSPGRFLDAVESGLAGWDRTLDPMLGRAERGEFPLELPAAMAGLVDDWAKDWVKRGEKIKENRSKEAANRMGAAKLFALLAHRYQHALRDAPRREHALVAIDLIAEAEGQIASNVQAGFVMERLAAGLAGAEATGVRPGG